MSIERGYGCLQTICGKAKGIFHLPYRPVFAVYMLLMKNQLHKAGSLSREIVGYPDSQDIPVAVMEPVEPILG
jgi:hypothetical protein